MSRARFALPTLACLCIIGCTQAAPPAPDFTDLPAYITALNTSHDPQAVAIRREIMGGPAALAREKAAAQRDGIPLTAPPVAASNVSQNAAPLWDQWDALRKQDPLRLPEYAETFSARFAYTPAQLDFVQKQFDTHPALVQLLHQAADRTTILYADPLYLHYAGLREAARELRTESYLLARQGRYADAVTDQARGFHIAEQFGSQPGLGSYLTGDAVSAITFSGLWDILKMAGPDAAVAAQVRQAVEAARPTLSLRATLLADIPQDMQTLEKLRSAPPSELATMTSDGRATPPFVAAKTWTPAQRRFINDLIDATEAQDLTEVQKLVAVTDAPDPAVRHRVFAAVLDGQGTLLDSPVTQLDPLLADSRILAGTFGTLDQADARAQAGIAVTLAATVALTAKAAAGAFPDALVSGPTDPFTGGPLGYRREGDTGFVVYSVGSEGTFDGGQPGDPDFLPRQVFFRFPGPVPQPVPADMLK